MVNLINFCSSDFKRIPKPDLGAVAAGGAAMMQESHHQHQFKPDMEICLVVSSLVSRV